MNREQKIKTILLDLLSTEICFKSEVQLLNGVINNRVNISINNINNN
jgi:hypothetical protein